MSRLREVLTDAELRDFTALLRRHRTNSIPLDDFVGQLAVLFGPKRAFLLPGLRAFLGDNQHVKFDELLDEYMDAAGVRWTPPHPKSAADADPVSSTTTAVGGRVPVLPPRMAELPQSPLQPPLQPPPQPSGSAMASTISRLFGLADDSDFAGMSLPPPTTGLDTPPPSPPPVRAAPVALAAKIPPPPAAPLKEEEEEEEETEAPEPVELLPPPPTNLAAGSHAWLDDVEEAVLPPPPPPADLAAAMNKRRPSFGNLLTGNTPVPVSAADVTPRKSFYDNSAVPAIAPVQPHAAGASILSQINASINVLELPPPPPPPPGMGAGKRDSPSELEQKLAPVSKRMQVLEKVGDRLAELHGKVKTAPSTPGNKVWHCIRFVNFLFLFFYSLLKLVVAFAAGLGRGTRGNARLGAASGTSKSRGRRRFRVFHAQLPQVP
jgi:hypothetical protein